MIESQNLRNPVFICGNNLDADGRVVVLRKADPDNNFIQFHSDIRSSKINIIKKETQIAHFYFMVNKKKFSFE